MRVLTSCKQSYVRCNQIGASQHAVLLGVVLLLSIIGVFRLVQSHAAAASPKLNSGISGYCLDDHADSTASGATVDIWKCNDTGAQAWAVISTSITHDTSDCLTVQGNSNASGSAVVLDTCDASAGQVWLRDKGGYQNPNSGLCLAASSASTVLPGESKTATVIATCDDLASPQEVWTPTALNSGEAKDSGPSTDSDSTFNDAIDALCSGTDDNKEGDKVACYAAADWTTWQAGSPDHETLLTSYTDGAPYEEWCADFVSYAYKQAGYPFTGGEADGWDESNANNIQNMGFVKHSATSGYLPKAGDIAYFDYSGGHVEIVVSGGRTPTFVYGNSATIDPTTGNGQMMANTTTSDGSQGQVVYYLSPE
jgi:hypothetical protein